MKQDQRPAKSPREHLDAIFNARSVLSFVGEAIGQSREEFSESANSGVFLILEHLRDDLEDAGNALSDALHRAPISMDANGVNHECVNGSDIRVAV